MVGTPKGLERRFSRDRDRPSGADPRKAAAERARDQAEEAERLRQELPDEPDLPPHVVGQYHTD